MPAVFLDITPELIVELCKGFRVGDSKRWFRIVENGLPVDARCLEMHVVQHVDGEGIIRLTLESEHFISEGQILPPVIATLVAED